MPRGAPRHRRRSRTPRTPPLLITIGTSGSDLLGVLGAIRAMHGRKPSHGLAIQVDRTDTELSFVDASQCLECLVKELVGPRLDALILGQERREQRRLWPAPHQTSRLHIKVEELRVIYEHKAQQGR